MQQPSSVTFFVPVQHQVLQQVKLLKASPFQLDAASDKISIKS